MTIDKKVTQLRKIMKDRGVDFYLVPSTDQHNNEYVPDCWQRRPWISGFDGSAGEVLIGQEFGYLWTDGRYFLQAEQQLDPRFFRLKKQKSFASELEEWLQDNIEDKVLAVDPKLISVARAQRLLKIADSYGGVIKFIEQNLVDEVKSQVETVSALPSEPLILHDIEYAGKSAREKIAELQSSLKSNRVDSIVLNSLDEIAWLYNIRGSDIDFNPLVISYAIVKQNQAYLYLDKNKLIGEALPNLISQGISVEEYESFANAVRNLEGKVWLDGKVASYWIKTLLPSNVKIHIASSPVVLAKACKNSTEIFGTKEAHKTDAVALVKFLHWINHNWQNGIDELKAIEQLKGFRAESPEFRGNSFDTISGFAENGAIIHYRSTPETSKKIDDSNLFLLDSGGQYFCGTTDITRTLHLGNPSAEQKKHYTLVLKGHLQLNKAIFPQGTTGEHLDCLARLAIWKDYKNYRHGTGHGVGSYLCVHEGPQKISAAPSGTPLLPGMIVSNEPGLYLDHKHGIRIENLMFVKELCSVKESGTQDGPFYGFEDVTLVPYSKKLIDESLLTPEELNWVNDYHQRVWNEISPKIQDDVVKDWLYEQTTKIG